MSATRAAENLPFVVPAVALAGCVHAFGRLREVGRDRQAA